MGRVVLVRVGRRCRSWSRCFPFVQKRTGCGPVSWFLLRIVCRVVGRSIARGWLVVVRFEQCRGLGARVWCSRWFVRAALSILR